MDSRKFTDSVLRQRCWDLFCNRLQARERMTMRPLTQEHQVMISLCCRPADKTCLTKTQDRGA